MTIKGKRLMALDYGDARIGVAVCDELHIVVSTRPVVPNTGQVLDELQRRVVADRIDMVVVGVPRRHDESSSEIIERCLAFIVRLREHLAVDVVETDEAFSTQRAHELMRSSGMSKKRRQQKGVKDQFAAAVILRDFLQEHST